MKQLNMTSSYTIHTAIPPKLGICTVTPSEGVFMQDKFSVKCSGFSDNSDPLTYMFYMHPGIDTTCIHGETVDRYILIAMFNILKMLKKY